MRLHLYLSLALCAASSQAVLAQSEPSTSAAEPDAATDPYADLQYASAEEPAPVRLGLSLALQGAHALERRAGAAGASLSFFFKLDHLMLIGQVGVSAWPRALHSDQRESLEVYLAASILPIDLGALDLGFFVLLAGHSFEDERATRAELGLAAQWSIDRAWTLRYQLGFAAETNLENVGLVSALAVDLAFL